MNSFIKSINFSRGIKIGIILLFIFCTVTPVFAGNNSDDMPENVLFLQAATNIITVLDLDNNEIVVIMLTQNMGDGIQRIIRTGMYVDLDLQLQYMQAQNDE